jgi:MoxR-like ATPase
VTEHFAPLLQDARSLVTPLPLQGSWPDTVHIWAQPELDALAAAAFAGRPLLVRGEPGVGKSQIARAAAALLIWHFEYEVITPRFEPEHLKWRYDAVRRLAEATAAKSVEDETRYVSPGALWRALSPDDPGGPRTSDASASGCVLLIDEIDKADSDLPNSLLEVLANRAFSTPWGTVPASGAAPHGLLVVITSNDERELPLAFLRRCVVLDMRPPAEASPAFVDWLLERGKVQFPQLASKVRQRAARQVQEDRLACEVGQGARPGLAEYLDLLRAVQGIAPDDTRKQLKWLQRLGRYVLQKQGQNPSDPGLPFGDGEGA